MEDRPVQFLNASFCKTVTPVKYLNSSKLRMSLPLKTVPISVTAAASSYDNPVPSELQLATQTASTALSANLICRLPLTTSIPSLTDGVVTLLSFIWAYSVLLPMPLKV